MLTERLVRYSALLAASLGCACPKEASPPATAPRQATGVAEAMFGARTPLALDRQRLRAAGATPALLAKLDASVYAYFRALAVEYSSRICYEFRDSRWRLPVAAIHGDAHLTQFVVTPTTFGLEDYDMAGFGPAVVDLVRFAASLDLACREAAWACQADRATVAFFREYRASLSAPPTRTVPAVAQRIRRRAASSPAASSRAAWLTWAGSLGQPLKPPLEQTVRRRWASFAAQQQQIFTDAPAGFYDLVEIERLQLGIGSAFETKYLARIRGETDDPNDDVVMEARSLRLPRPYTGIWTPHHGGSLHTLYLMFLLGPRLPQRFGTAVLNDDPSAPEFWLQSWEPGYAELSLSDLQSQTDLEELAIDAARQLAGHFWVRFPEPLRPIQRFNQLEALDTTEERARALAKVLADETFASWRRFADAG